MATDPNLEFHRAKAAGATNEEASNVYRAAHLAEENERFLARQAASQAEATSRRHAEDTARAAEQRRESNRHLRDAAAAAQRTADIEAARLEEDRHHRAAMEREAQAANEILAQQGEQARQHQHAMLGMEREKVRRSKESACPLYLVAKKVHALRVRTFCEEQVTALHALQSRLSDAREQALPRTTLWLVAGPALNPEFNALPIAPGAPGLSRIEKRHAALAARIGTQKSPSAKRQAELAQAEAELQTAIAQRQARDSLASLLEGLWRDDMREYAARLETADSNAAQVLAAAEETFEAWHARAMALAVPELSPRACIARGGRYEIAGWQGDSDDAAERFVDYDTCVLMAVHEPEPGQAPDEYPGLGRLPRSGAEVAALLAALKLEGPENHGGSVAVACQGAEALRAAVRRLPELRALVSKWQDPVQTTRLLRWSVDVGMHAAVADGEDCQLRLATLLRPEAGSAAEADFLWHALGEARAIHPDRWLASKHQKLEPRGMAGPQTLDEWLGLTLVPEAKPKHKYLNTVHVLDPAADLSGLIDQFETGDATMVRADGRIEDLSKRTEPTLKDFLIGLATLVLGSLLVIGLARKVYLMFA